MASTLRELFTVDLRGLRAALDARAQGAGLTSSDFVRQALNAALQVVPPATAPTAPQVVAAGDRVAKVSLRLRFHERERLSLGAQRAGVSRDRYVADLICGRPLPEGDEQRGERLAALTRSNSHLVAIAWNVKELVRLIRTGSIDLGERPEVVQGLAVAVKNHLELASRVIADLKSAARTTSGTGIEEQTSSGGAQ